MANIALTNKCNRSCRYCFAPHKEEFIDEIQFDNALNFLERSSINELRMLGGEPTLHPYFNYFVEKSLNRGFDLLVFSNGYMPTTTLDFLEKIPQDRIKVLFNVVTDPENFKELNNKQIDVLRRLEHKIIPGFNIDHPGIQLNFLLDIVLEFNTQPKIRLGLAHPKMDGSNYSLHPRYYPIVGTKIAEFMKITNLYDVKVEFDCGFVPCMFPPDSYEIIGEVLATLGQRCNPIIDILPNGKVISCYPLSNFQQEELPTDQDDKWLREEFLKRQKPFRNMYLYKKCKTCIFKSQGYCVGGCLSASMQRQRQHPFSLSITT